MEKNVNLLKEILSVPTKTYNEYLMIQFLTDWLEENELNYYIDNMYNIYVTKTEHEIIPDDFYFPCVVAHTDTVHVIEPINIEHERLPNAQGEIKDALKAYNDFGNPTGIGGDDKCGIFACLELIKKLPNIKAGFFVSEETGCHGSLKADKEFFKDVGYVLEFDAPYNWMVSEICSGVRLFNRESDFFVKCNDVLSKNMNKRDMRYMSNPYTDVYALKKQFDFSCINFSIGYYNYHTREEYVIIDDVFNGIKIGEEMIKSLGNKKYHYKYKDIFYDDFII